MILRQHFIEFLVSRLPGESHRVKNMHPLESEHQFWSLDDIGEDLKMLCWISEFYSQKEAIVIMKLLLNGCLKHRLVVEQVEIPALEFEWKGQSVSNMRGNIVILHFAPRVSFTLSELLSGLGKVANGPN